MRLTRPNVLAGWQNLAQFHFEALSQRAAAEGDTWLAENSQTRIR